MYNFTKFLASWTGRLFASEAYKRVWWLSMSCLNSMILVWKIIKFCMQNETSQGHKIDKISCLKQGSEINDSWNRVRVWRTQRHISTKTSLECLPPGTHPSEPISRVPGCLRASSPYISSAVLRWLLAPPPKWELDGRLGAGLLFFIQFCFLYFS